jgi:GT2 family glycosyltransferase
MESPATDPAKRRPLIAAIKAWCFRRVVENYWMRIEVLRQYEPRPVRWDRIAARRSPDARLPRIGLVTPSFNQGDFLAATLQSVISQDYPKLLYAVQDGGSSDASAGVIARHASGLTHWESKSDRGQADAVARGFGHLTPRLDPNDVMGWLNSDDLLAPGSLRFVGDYFARHPTVDVLYGHRLIIDREGREIGRWILPRHDPRALEWVDYVPQETLFWRKRAWDRAGGLDLSFQFALDWDLLARFTASHLRVVRVPRFLGAFRVHPQQKTSQHIHSTGAQEMARIRRRFHGEERSADWDRINAWARRVRFRGALTARLHELGIRY